MNHPLFQRIAILGLGLMGGSLALSIRKNHLAVTIVGQGRRKESLKNAVRNKTIDVFELDPKLAVENADLVILASPIRVIEQHLKQIAHHLKNGAIVMDVGSTKADIVKAAAVHLPKNVFFVGAHPLAGTEDRGVESSVSDLYEGKICVLAKNNAPSTIFKKVKQFWEEVGMKVVLLDSQHHDNVLAATSHLPQLASYALMNAVTLLTKPLERKDLSGSGLRDTTRIAASPPDIWLDICDTNQSAILKSLQVLQAELKKIELAVKTPATLKRIFTAASASRKKL